MIVIYNKSYSIVYDNVSPFSIDAESKDAKEAIRSFQSLSALIWYPCCVILIFCSNFEDLLASLVIFDRKISKYAFRWDNVSALLDGTPKDPLGPRFGMNTSLCVRNEGGRGVEKKRGY